MQRLYLRYNQLRTLPSEIGKLKNLQVLYLRFNKLTTLPPEIGELENLRTLYLRNNKLVTLPPEIGELSNLRTLHLRNNKLVTLPPGIGNLKKLPGLYLSDNKLTTLPAEIGKLNNLQVLYLKQNDIKTLPPEIGDLENLEILDLGDNKLMTLPPRIGDLKNLQTLNLKNNYLTNIPLEIGNLKNLQKLDLTDNKLTKLPSEISEIGVEIHERRRFFAEGIYLEGNPLESPPIEIVKKGMDAIIEYFKSLKEQGARAINEIKLLLVGQGGAGKTSLVNRMLRNMFNKEESQTNGINIDPWEIETDGRKIHVNIWDFGGQEIMHTTHQFFLSERSFYILVLDCRKEEKVEHWLKQIQSFGGDSPIMVVINKIEENPGYDLDRRSLKEKYRGIKGVWDKIN